ncbi:hypothetical protein PR048_018211 [Dryococelus australis]|uniref:CCHC-type domain-containing protein n=1 Tax=Dryococelus australis TaxID=614101 RepID=A0ABQ9HBW1_9NEOP|nr:hypothetical protein PR048_018211 [Dryococelus australis]
MMGKILSSLPDRFRHFLTAWESTPKSDRTLTNLTARLLAEEERGNTSSTHDNVAFKTVNKNIVCFKCNKRGHIAQNCMKKELGCKICKKYNHTEQNCYLKYINKTTTSCTSHMIKNNDYLTNVIGIESEITTSKKNENMCAELKGDIEYQECVLKNVLYVPGLTRNQISVHKITADGGIVKFTDNSVEMLKGRAKITGEKDNAGLYNTNLNCSETILLPESKQTSDLNLWHRRIGHLNVFSMKKLATLSSGLEKLKLCASEIQCETCLTSKQTRKHFGKAR